MLATTNQSKWQCRGYVSQATMLCSFETQSLEEQFIEVQILLMQYLWYRVNVNLLALYFTLKPNSKPLQELVSFILPKLEDIRQ